MTAYEKFLFLILVLVIIAASIVVLIPETPEIEPLPKKNKVPSYTPPTRPPFEWHLPGLPKTTDC